MPSSPGIAPAPQRKTPTTWNEFIGTHMDVLVTTDFFTAEVWRLGGMVMYDALYFLQLESRRVHIAGSTPHPEERWMRPIPDGLRLISAVMVHSPPIGTPHQVVPERYP
jgi:putative transposase